MSTRKLAERFAEAGWSVVWLEPPRPPWRHHSARAHGREGREPAARAATTLHNVAQLAPRTIVPFSLRIPGFWRVLVRRSWNGCIPGVVRSLAQAGVSRPDVLWLSHIAAFGLPRLFPGVPVVWQVTDDYPLLSRTERRCRELLCWNLAQADAVLFSSPLLLDRYAAFCRRVRRQPSVLPHGVDSWRLAASAPPSEALPPASGPRVVYVGNTQRADLELLCALAKYVDVVVIGDPRPFDGRVLPGARLHLLGSRRPEEVGRLLVACDFGIVCYSREQLRAAAEGGNPMKAYEYAAAGLPILAPRLPVFERLEVPVSYYDDLDSLRARVQAAPAEQERARMRAWAAGNTWEQRFLRVEHMLGELLPERSAPVDSHHIEAHV